MDDDETITITLLDSEHDRGPVSVTVNGRTITVKRNEPTEVHLGYAEALSNSGYRFTVATPEGPGLAVGAEAGAEGLATRDGPDDDHAKTGQVDKEFAATGYVPTAGAAGAETAPGAPTVAPPALEAGSETVFDADGFIAANVEMIEPRLAALPPAQLAQVLAAEKDREKPRKGVLDAIAKLQADQASA